jgi:hypothetical protein
MAYAKVTLCVRNANGTELRTQHDTTMEALKAAAGTYRQHGDDVRMRLLPQTDEAAELTYLKHEDLVSALSVLTWL